MLDETAAAPAAAADTIEIDSSFFAQLNQTEPTEDPRLIRWGYNPGVRSTQISPLQTGLKELFIPIGKFIPHQTFPKPLENCTLDEYKPKEYNVDVLAAEVQANFERVLGQDVTSDRHWGYQSFGYGEKNAVKVKAMEQILLPTLQEIREMFGKESPIADHCKGEDEMDLGDERNHCASCHLEWIKSDAVKFLIVEAAQTGKKLNVRRPDGVVVPMSVAFTVDELESLRATVQLGLELYKRQAHKDWSKLLNEHENGLRDQIQEAEHFLRKDLHEPRPQNKDAALVERMIDAQARSQQPAGAPAADNSELIKTLAEGQAMMAQLFAGMQQLMAQMMANQAQQATQPAPSVVETPASVAPEKPTAKTKNKGAETAEK